MTKNRCISILILIAAAIMLVGCSAVPVINSAPVPTKTTAPTATPSPTPVPLNDVATLFGKQITIAVISNAGEAQSALFFDGATQQAQSLGLQIETVAAGELFERSVNDALENGVDAIIAALFTKPDDYDALNYAAEQGVVVSVFSMEKYAPLSIFSNIYYQKSNVEEIALEAALVYPPHDTPVRLLLMFESPESKAYTVYEQLYAQGKIFPKEIYFMSDDTEADEEINAPSEWLNAQLDKYVEGMIDAIFAENTFLAMQAVDTLKARGRTDMEVFCVGLTAKSVELMDENPEVFVQAAGVDSYLAGLLAVRTALIQIAGESIITLALNPSLVTAYDGDTMGALSALNADLYALYDTERIRLLREYYKNQ